MCIRVQSLLNCYSYLPVYIFPSYYYLLYYHTNYYHYYCYRFNADQKNAILKLQAVVKELQEGQGGRDEALLRAVQKLVRVY